MTTTDRSRRALIPALLMLVTSLAMVVAPADRSDAQVVGDVFSLWPTTDTPQVPVVNDPNAVELGLRFQAATSGRVLGIRIYRGSAGGAGIQGSLWTADGASLARAALPGGSQSGWQTITFPQPVDIEAGTVYVASYFAPAGAYAATNEYFRTPRTAGPLSTAEGSNGVYRYGTTGFPTQTYRSTNYWVDVLFQPAEASPTTSTSTTPPTSTSTPTSTTVPPTSTTSTAPSPPPSGRTFFVSPAGNDSNAGTIDRPWRTFGASVRQLQAGDTLIARGGVYSETDLAVTLAGTATRPVTIKAQPGETPVIDGALDAFEPSGNQAWVLVDGARNIWRSAQPLPDPGSYGYTGRIDVDGELYALTSYKDNQLGTGLQFLSAGSDLYTDDRPYYMGPGITYHTDRHVYIRLDPNTATAQWNQRAPFVIADRDPRHHPVFVAPNSAGLRLSGSHIIVDGIHLRHHWATLAGNATDVTIRNLVVRPGRFGARVSGDRWVFDNVTIDHDRSSWVARSDVKGAYEPAKDSRTSGIDWENADGGQLRNSRILGSFDCMLALGDNRGLRIIGNVLDQCMDDGIQTGIGVHDMEFAHNLVTGAGPSHDKTGTGDTPDSIYIHHNVFDNTSRTFWARKPATGESPSENGWHGYECAPIFSTHGGTEYRDPWKIYSNTFQACTAPGQQGVNHYLYGGSRGRGLHEVYNNIINITNPDYVYRWADAAAGDEIYDGNIYGRTEPLWAFGLEVITSNGPLLQIRTFTEWQATMGASSRSYYPPGWDARSVALNRPVPLTADYRPAPDSPAATGAIDLSSKGWPGSTYAPWRGAKAP